MVFIQLLVAISVAWLNKKTAVEHVAGNAVMRQGRGNALTSSAVIIRKALLHLTNISQLSVIGVTYYCLFSDSDYHAVKYERDITLRT